MVKRSIAIAILFATAFLLIYSPPVLADLQRGIEAYQRGDYGTALEHLMPLADGGHATAQFYMGLMYSNGQGVTENKATAASWYWLAAHQQVPEAKLNLGLLYLRGDGVPKDSSQAVRWLTAAAEDELADAQFQLGLMHFEGIGVAKNEATAAQWFKKAANQDHAVAQRYLGFQHYQGTGVPVDYVAAADWFLKSANHGDDVAQMFLGVMYILGHGVEQDPVQAYVWVDRAASVGNVDAKNLRDKLALELDPETLAEAKRVARGEPPTPAPAIARSEPSPQQTRPSGISRSLVIAIQSQLLALGYDVGLVDGILGPRTRAAIRAFQENHSIAATGDVSEQLARVVSDALLQVHAADTPTKEPEVDVGSDAERNPDRYGSGFSISAKGHVLTSAHVIEGCAEVTAGPSEAKVIAYDPQNDLALLMPSEATESYARFREGRGVRPGDNILVIGYPLFELLSSEPSVAAGIVSALSTQGDDRRVVQISAPIQPGNSGGPLLDSSGNIVGIIAFKLDAIEVARATGDIPQNINFAINAGTIRAFLDSYNVEYETSQSTPTIAPADIAAHARSFTVLVVCWK